MKTTRDMLLAAAARELNGRGYFGTDTNRIARAAGFAPATFYKHFDDKRAVFLAVYDDWVEAELAAVADVLASGGDPALVAARVADLLIDHHRRWQGFRASLRALVATDAAVRRHHRRNRSRQLDRIAAFAGGPVDARRRSHDIVLVLILERLCDAIADGEAGALGADEALLRDELVARLVASWRR